MNRKKEGIIKYKGELDLIGSKQPCYVLEDGRRVLSGRVMQDVLKMVDEVGDSGHRPPGTRFKRYLEQKSLQSFIYKGKKVDHFDPIICYDGEQKIHGYEATLLIDFCDGMLEARKSIKLPSLRQEIIAEQCEKLVRILAKVSIIALVDEATGYQYVRERFALQKILKLYIAPEILKWRKLFEPSYYRELFRLWNISPTIENMNRKPRFIGWLTNELVYKNLPEGVLEALKEKTPKTKGGYYRHKLHQSLTPNIGRKEAERIIHEVEVLAWTSKDKNEFLRKMKARYHPKKDLPAYIDIEAMDDNKKETKVDKALKALLKTPKPKKDE